MSTSTTANTALQPRQSSSSHSSTNIELCLLIFKALQNGPYGQAAQVLKEQIEKQETFKRIDYLGKQHEASLDSLLLRHPNITHNSLELIIKQLKNMLDQQFPSSIQQGLDSYLLAGQFSLLRTSDSLFKEDVKHSVKSLLSNRLYAPAYKRHSVNILIQIQSRKLRGPACIRRTIPTEFYSRTILYRRIFGHLAPVYCVTFDMTGQYIFTGADDNLIKIWSARDGRLLSTLRGHSGEITDLSVNYENRLLASGSMDKFIRVWDLRTTRMIECLNAHTAMITSVKFAPYNRRGTDRYLISTSNDGSIIFWTYHVDKFEFRKLRQFRERSRPGGQMICSSFSSGGSFLACGSSDKLIHVYGFNPDLGPYAIKELDKHKDQVDSIQFCNNGFRFLSGSKDGTAVIWTYRHGLWNPMELNMNTHLTAEDASAATALQRTEPLQVSMVAWSTDDAYVITSLSDCSVKVWNPTTGQLVHVLKQHTAEVYLIESHPKDPRIFLTGSHDGKIILWDIELGRRLKVFQNLVDGQGNASLYDCKFSPDGSMFVVTDSYGHLSLFGFGSDDPYQSIPDQMFFNYDYRGLVRDINNFVMDEQTHLLPHAMSHLMQLVDMNGAPHPRPYQRLVPVFTDVDVIPPLTKTQQENISDLIKNHSIWEDDEYIFQKSDQQIGRVQPKKPTIPNQYMSREVARLLNVYRDPQMQAIGARRRVQAPPPPRVIPPRVPPPLLAHDTEDDDDDDDDDDEGQESTEDTDTESYSSNSDSSDSDFDPSRRPPMQRRHVSSRPVTRRSGRIRRENSRQSSREYELDYEPGPSRISPRSSRSSRRSRPISSRQTTRRIVYFPADDEEETDVDVMDVQTSQSAAARDDDETEEDEQTARGETTEEVVDSDLTEIDEDTRDLSNSTTRSSARLANKRKRYSSTSRSKRAHLERR